MGLCRLRHRVPAVGSRRLFPLSYRRHLTNRDEPVPAAIGLNLSGAGNGTSGTP
jgi:hypothetical protein